MTKVIVLDSGLEVSTPDTDGRMRQHHAVVIKLSSERQHVRALTQKQAIELAKAILVVLELDVGD